MSVAMANWASEDLPIASRPKTMCQGLIIMEYQLKMGVERVRDHFMPRKTRNCGREKQKRRHHAQLNTNLMYYA